jgi:hypothetical protein
MTFLGYHLPNLSDAQNPLDVSCSVEHSHNFNRRCLWKIDNEVVKSMLPLECFYGRAAKSEG